MKRFTNEEFSAEKVKAQVDRFQEMMYDFIKGLSKIKKQQDNFSKTMSERTF